MPEDPIDPPTPGEGGPPADWDALKNSDFKAMFDLFRKQMEHEDVLVYHRITFNTVIQTAFITAFVLAENIKVLPVSTIDGIRVGLALIGMALVLYALGGILAAVNAANSLARQCDEMLQTWKKWADQKQPTFAPFVPSHCRGGNSKRWHFWGFWFGPWAFVTFLFVWIAALVILATRCAGVTPNRYQLAPNAGQAAGDVYIFDSQTGEVWRREAKGIPTK